MAGMLILAGCKNITDARSNSFRATHRNWIFGQEQTTMLLHQFVYDLQGMESANRQQDDLERALGGISACWYKVTAPTIELKPLIESNDFAAIYAHAQITTEHAVPMNQFLKTAEKVPELRTINNSFKKQTARLIFDLPADTAIDFAFCTAGLQLLSCVTTGPACPGFSGVVGFACGLVLGLSGLGDGLRTPWDKLTDPLEDRFADAAGKVLKDQDGRRKSILERLPIVKKELEGFEGSYYQNISEFPVLGWKEMQRLSQLFSDLGSPTQSIDRNGKSVTRVAHGKATWVDGSFKRFSKENQCASIAELQRSGKFQNPNGEGAPLGLQQSLSSEGVPREFFAAFGSTASPADLEDSEDPSMQRSTSPNRPEDSKVQDTLTRYAP